MEYVCNLGYISFIYQIQVIIIKYLELNVSSKFIICIREYKYLEIDRCLNWYLRKFVIVTYVTIQVSERYKQFNYLNSFDECSNSFAHLNITLNLEYCVY